MRLRQQSGVLHERNNMADIDKIDLILESINEIKGTLKEMNGRQRSTEQTVTAHGIQIDHLEKRPTGVRAMSIIAGLFTLVNGALAMLVNRGGP